MFKHGLYDKRAQKNYGRIIRELVVGTEKENKMSNHLIFQNTNAGKHKVNVLLKIT